MKVLVVDDEASVRKSLVRAAGSKGHIVSEAADGESALKVWKKERPDLVYLDVLMPNLNGPQVLKEMGKTSAKVVMISAYTGEYDLEKAQNLGADLFIAKPFDDIFAVIEKGEALVHGG